LRIPAFVSRKRARIEIIPLIDIVFFLLATFVMVSMSMVRNQGIPVNLPQASSGAAIERKSTATVTIAESAALYLDKQNVTIGELKDRLTALWTADPDLRVVIQGDKNALLGSAVTVLDEIRNLGITKVAIRTKSAELQS
jgi:biopolymer transport protein ExbD